MADAMNAYEATLVGDQLPGRYKWSTGVLAANGNIYGIPSGATQVLCFDPRTQEATRVGDQLPGDHKWAGGVLAADGKIYGIPEDAAQVLRFDPCTQQATLAGAELPGFTKWNGGVLAADGNIYGIPYHATQVLSVAAVKAAAPVAAVKEHVPGEKVLDANETSFAYIKPSP